MLNKYLVNAQILFGQPSISDDPSILYLYSPTYSPDLVHTDCKQWFLNYLNFTNLFDVSKILMLRNIFKQILNIKKNLNN